MSFGRKGVGTAPQDDGYRASRPARRQGAASNPWGQSNPVTDLQSKRDAFAAAERARGNFGSVSPAKPGGHSPGWGAMGMDRSVPAGRRQYVMGDPQKRNLIVAYVLWYFASPIGMHRFYCGQPQSAWTMIGLLVAGLVVLGTFPPLGIAMLLGWALWIFFDLFLIPGMLRRFKEHAARHYDGVFD